MKFRSQKVPSQFLTKDGPIMPVPTDIAELESEALATLRNNRAVWQHILELAIALSLAEKPKQIADDDQTETIDPPLT
jgi:hypothetical protein